MSAAADAIRRAYAPHDEEGKGAESEAKSSDFVSDPLSGMPALIDFFESGKPADLPELIDTDSAAAAADTGNPDRLSLGGMMRLITKDAAFELSREQQEATEAWLYKFTVKWAMRPDLPQEQRVVIQDFRALFTLTTAVALVRDAQQRELEPEVLEASRNVNSVMQTISAHNTRFSHRAKTHAVWEASRTEARPIF